jgi:hypothetical protein
MNRAVVVGLIGIVSVGGATLYGRHSSHARYDAAIAKVNADCRAYRGEGVHLHAAVCRAPDEFEPKAIALRKAAAGAIALAKSSLERNDVAKGELQLRMALSHHVDRVEGMGTRVSELVAVSIVNEALNVARDYPAVDAQRVFAGIHLASARDPFAGDRLQKRWTVAHDTTQSHGAIADQLEALEHVSVDTSRYDWRELTRTAARLDDAREGRLSSSPTVARR